MVTEPGEHRELLAAGQHVDGVDLYQPHPLQHPASVAAVDGARGTAIGETLGRQRDAPGLGCRQSVGHRGETRRETSVTLSGRLPDDIGTVCPVSPRHRRRALRAGRDLYRGGGRTGWTPLDVSP